jgi:hypothetical protein
MSIDNLTKSGRGGFLYLFSEVGYNTIDSVHQEGIYKVIKESRLRCYDS